MSRSSSQSQSPRSAGQKTHNPARTMRMARTRISFPLALGGLESGTFPTLGSTTRVGSGVFRCFFLDRFAMRSCCSPQDHAVELMPKQGCKWVCFYAPRTQILTLKHTLILMSSPLEISAPAMRIIVGWTGFQSGRRVIRTLVCRRATHLHDYNRKKTEQFRNFELHVLEAFRMQGAGPSHFHELTHTEHKCGNGSRKKDSKAAEDDIFTSC
jgi:hypothetical protein